MCRHVPPTEEHKQRVRSKHHRIFEIEIVMTAINVFKRLCPGGHRVTTPTWIIYFKICFQDSWSAQLSQTPTHLSVGFQNITR